MKKFFLRQRRISHFSSVIKERKETAESSGEFITITKLPWESYRQFSDNLKEAFKAEEICTINGFALEDFDQNLNVVPFLFYKLRDFHQPPSRAPLQYRIDFPQKMNEVLENFKSEFKRLFIELIEEEEYNIDMLREHTDCMDRLNVIFLMAFNLTMSAFPEFASCTKLNDYEFFRNPFNVFDSMARFIKSFIFSDEYEKHIDADKDDAKNASIFVNIIAEHLFKNIQSYEWFTSLQCRVPAPLLIDGRDIYAKNQNVLVKPVKRTFLRHMEPAYDVASKEERELTPIDILQNDLLVWEYVKKMLESIGDEKLMVVYLPLEKVKDIFLPEGIEYVEGKVKFTKKTPSDKVNYVYLSENMQLQIDDGQDVKNMKNVKLYVQDPIIMFYSF